MDALFRIVLVEGFGVCALLILGNAFRWWGALTAPRWPIREKLLRSPGETLRRNLEQLNEYLVYSVAVFLLVPMLFAWQAPILTNVWALVFLVCLMGLCALPGLLVVRLHRNYALGLRAERAVGEELNQLMLDGCRVFHDYPANGTRTIDHVVVAPSGVYVIETWVQRKRGSSEGEETSEVIFDGKSLRFPGLTTTAPIQESRRCAAELAAQLTSALGEAVEVRPMLTMPGWWIKDRSTSDVAVLNPKDIWQRIVTVGPPKLTAERIAHISHYLQQKCRDVEL